VAAGDALRMMKSEGIAHVVATFLGLKGGLASAEKAAAQHSAVYRNTRGSGYSESYLAALIVATLIFAPPSERHRHHDIYAVEEAFRRMLRRTHLSKPPAKMAIAAVFEVVDEIARLPMRCVIHQA